MTLQELTDFTESLLSADQDPEWSSDELTGYLKTATIMVFSKFWYLIYPHKRKYATLNIAAGATVALPVDCYRVGQINLADTGEVLEPIQEDRIGEMKLYNDAEYPVAWLPEGANIRLFPTPTQAKTAGLEVWYLPTWSTHADLPESLHPLIGIQAAKLAKYKDHELQSDLMALEKEYDDAARQDLTVANL